MSREKIFFLVAAGWELVRFAALFALLTVRPDAPATVAYSVTTLWFGSGQLALAGACIMLAFYPVRYAPYIPLVRLGKFVSIGPALLSLFIGVPVPVISAAPIVDLVRMATPVAILTVDSILFLFLLSYRVNYGDPSARSTEE